MDTIIQHSLETNFENFLTGNTITQEQAIKIKAIINKSKDIEQEKIVNTKNLIGQGRKIYLDSKDINYINLLKDLVDKGNITQQQAEKIIMKQIYLRQIKWSITYFKSLFRED